MTNGDTGSAPARISAALAVLLYGVLALLAQHSLLGAIGRQVYSEGVLWSDCLLHVWTIAWDQHVLFTDPRLLFDGNIFFPHQNTLLYSDHLLGLAVLLAPLRLFTDNVVLVHNLVTVAAPAINALAMYALARHLTRRVGASLVAGLLYGFAPLRFGIDECQIQTLAAWWLPLAYLFAHRAVAMNRALDGVLAGAVLALQGLTGIYLSAFFAPFLGLAQLLWLWRYPFARFRHGWVTLLASEAMAVLAMLPFAIAYRSVQTDLGIRRSAVMNALFSLDPSDLPNHLPVLSLGLLLAGGLWARRRFSQTPRGEVWLWLVMLVGAFLLSLGPVLSLPGELGSIPGLYRLLIALPGYDALRGPSRMMHIALLAASLLAAGSFAAITAKLSRRARALACLVVLAAIAVESRPPPADLFQVPSPPEIDPVYDWIAAQPDDFRYAELPTGGTVLSSQMCQYASTWHWKPRLLGHMGLVPPASGYMQQRLMRFPDRDALTSLSDIGINHVVVHLDRVRKPIRERTEALAATTPSPLTQVYRHEDTAVFALRPDLRPRKPRKLGEPLDTSKWKAAATHNDLTAGHAIDADPETSWASRGELERAARSLRFDPVPFSRRMEQFREEQPSQLTIDLGSTHTLRTFEFRIGGTPPDAYHLVVVHSSLDGESWKRLSRPLEPVPDVLGLVAHPSRARFRIPIVRHRRARFLRISCSWRGCNIGDVQAYEEIDTAPAPSGTDSGPVSP
jgi:hypothetical protein